MAEGARVFGMDKAAVPGTGRHVLRMANFEGNPLTSDRRRFERDAVTLENQPELATGAPTYAWVRAAMHSIDELQKWPADMGPSCPTLIVIAGQDQVVDNIGTLKFVDRAPGFSSLTIADSRHEILNERSDIRERFFAALEGFIGP
jgi:lysophospholipase